MSKKREFVIEVEGTRLFFWAEDRDRALEIVESGLNAYQDVCKHKRYKNGACEECGLECEHEDVEGTACQVCGAYVEKDRGGDAAFEVGGDR